MEAVQNGSKVSSEYTPSSSGEGKFIKFALDVTEVILSAVISGDSFNNGFYQSAASDYGLNGSRRFGNENYTSFDIASVPTRSEVSFF